MRVTRTAFSPLRSKKAAGALGVRRRNNHSSSKIYSMEKVSKMLIAVAGDLLKSVDSLEEMQAHLDLVKTAWNMSLSSGKKRNGKLKKFIESQRPHAPSIEALEGLEWEFRRIMKQKDKIFPTVKRKVEFATAIETSKDDYIIRAYFTDGAERNPIA